jgi:hypothetical protein
MIREARIRLQVVVLCSYYMVHGDCFNMYSVDSRLYRLNDYY